MTLPPTLGQLILQSLPASAYVHLPIAQRKCRANTSLSNDKSHSLNVSPLPFTHRRIKSKVLEIPELENVGIITLDRLVPGVGFSVTS